jgi:hypothetical protein
MPLEISDFPEELQVAFFIYNILSDRISDSSGVILGKYWDDFPYYCSLYGVSVEEQKLFITFLKYYEYLIVNKAVKEFNEKNKRANSKAGASGGKNYTHNVKG